MILKQLLLLLFTLCSAEVKLSENLTSRIIGGNDANIFAFPFSMGIDVRTSTSTFYCGGALYSAQFIITAGQCVNGGLEFAVYMSSSSRPSSLGVLIVATEYILHPDYNPSTLENDIGLIKFWMPIELTSTIKPIGQIASEPLVEARALRIVGWGQRSDENSTLSSIMEYANVVSLSNDICKIAYGNQIVDSMVCVQGETNEGPCYGDTGGPLIDYGEALQTILVGVSSFLSGNGCESTDPSGYTRIYPYAEWIRNVTSI